VTPGSSCPNCNHKLSWWENIPVLSFLILRGKCSSCNSGISFQYPAVELLTAATAVALWFKYGWSLRFLVMSLFSAALIVVSFIDLAHQIIPDIISLPGIVIGIVASLFSQENAWVDSLLGAIIGGGILYLVTWAYYLLTGKIGMGGGDIKLLAMIGAFLGWKSLPAVIFLSAVSGSIIGLLVISFNRAGRDYKIPFGPFLAFAAEVQVLYGKHIYNLYWSFFS